MPRIDANRNASRRTVKIVRPKPAPPTDAQVRQAKAQEQTYASQGKAVQTQARQQRKVRVARQNATAPSVVRAGDNKAQSEFTKGQDYVRAQYGREKKLTSGFGVKYQQGTTVPPREAVQQKLRSQVEHPQLAAWQQPALKVLEQTTRPLHALAATERQLIRDKGQINLNTVKAFGRGIANKDKSTTSDILGDVGWKPKGGAGKLAKGALSLTGDVIGDPITYVTGGAATVAARQAEKVAARVAKQPAVKAAATAAATHATSAADRAVAKAAAKAQGQGKQLSTRHATQIRAQTAAQHAQPTLPQRAADRKLKTGDQTKGVIVRVAGHEVPGVRKATAVASKPVRAAARKVVSQKTRDSARSIAADVNPNAAPVGVSKDVSLKAVQATRTARAKANQGDRQAVNLAHGIKSQIGAKNYSLVVDAIEAGKIKTLPEGLRPHAVALRSQFKYIRRVQRQSGVAVADATRSPQVKGYVPRQLTEDAAQAAGVTGKATVIKPGSSKARSEKRPMAQVRVAKPGAYREDLHALAAQRMSEGTASAARADLAQTLGDMGRPVKRGQAVTLDKTTEAVFHIAPGKVPRHVTDPKELDRALKPLTLNKKGTKVKGATPKSVGAGRYVMLNKDVVKRSIEGATPTLQGPGIVHTLDKGTSAFKRIAIATPGFHLRNFVGDMQNAYLGQPAHRLPGNMRRAAKVLHAHGGGEKAMRHLTPSEVGQATFKTTQYGHVTYDEAAKRLAEHGAFDSGYIAGELKELSGSGGLSTGKVATKVRGAREKVGQTNVAQGTKRTIRNRENLPRLTTAMEALRHGATWEQAAQAVANLHFDYQHLTNFERQIARRAAPFYTWSARNIPLQTRKLVTHPGKYANYQKVRENATKMAGVQQQDQQTRDLYRKLEAAGVKLPKGWERYLSEWEQRNAGVPISWKGHKFTLSVGLPLQDLNELPGAAGKGQLTEYANKAMSLANPLAKDPLEIGFNYSFFFRDQVQRDTSPLVAAPSIVASFPDAAKRKLGVTKMIDKRTGKKVWAWPGKVDYAAHTVPGIPNYAQQFATPGSDRRGKGLGGKVLGFAGVKSVPVDPVRNATNLAYARMQEIQTRLAAIRQTGVGKDHPTPEWRKLSDQLKLVTQIAYQGKVAQGYKVLPSSGGPSKSVSGGFKFNSGGSGFKFNQGSSGFKFH